jgi:type II restriction enzyme
MNQKSDVDSFFQTLTPEILSPGEYLDWEKINRKVKSLRREIALLQSLDKDDALNDLTDILQTNPNVLKVLQLLIAHTPDKILFDKIDKYIDFTSDLEIIGHNKDRAEKVAGIFIEMGLITFLCEVKSVEDVVKGVLIGLEPNSRKNRRGIKAETMANDLIKSVVKKINRRFNINLSVKSQLYIQTKKGSKNIDFVISKDEKEVIAIEVNFFSTTGSKPSEVLSRAYPDVQSSLSTEGVELIVITDGSAWLKMKPVVETAFKKLKYLMNFRQAKQGMLERAILEILKVKH